MRTSRVVIPIVLAVFVPVQLIAQEKTGGDNAAPAEHHHGVNQRGDQVMGFSHEKTTHHFRLYPDGGGIEVQANDPKDTTSLDPIRMHLAHIARKFAEGDFNAPMLIHSRVPPGVPTMKRLKGEISYQYSEMDAGAKLRITTKNPEALKAIHRFLRFQISDHQTGDSGKVEEIKN